MRHVKVILFDVNETLLDLRAMDPIFERYFGNRSVLPLWFSQLLRSAMVATITGEYHDFGEMGRVNNGRTTRDNPLPH